MLNFDVDLRLNYFIIGSGSFYIRINFFMGSNESVFYCDDDNFFDVFNDSFE